METSLLDDVHDRIKGDSPHDALDRLFRGLYAFRKSSEPAAWREFIERCRSHPLKDLLHLDPFTRRAFSKPRGYAGDAIMMDYIYYRGEKDGAREPNSIGEIICEHTTNVPSSRAVRSRRDILSDAIDEVADQVHRPIVVSLACGHLREAQRAASVARGKIGRLIALDQDEESLGTVASTLGSHGVEVVRASVVDILRKRVELPRSDFIATAGLYDYLSQPLATRLTGILFDMLRPGGRLLISNFLPDIPDVGYMEAFMDWNLVYRDEGQMLGLLDEVPPGVISRQSTFVEPNQNVIFLDARRG